MPSNSREKDSRFHLEVVKQMVTLSTSGFGLVAALAWNNFIQELVKSYISKWFPQNGGLISLFIYALIITVLAVLVTVQLSRIASGLEKN